MFHWKWVNRPSSGSANVPPIKRPLLLKCKKPYQPPSCLCPLMGSQHPSGGLFSPMEFRTDHIPMCTSPNGTYSSGMVLHIKSYALHGLISHRDHRNVNHISSILLNICIKTLIHWSIAQRHYKKPTIQDQRKRRNVLLG
jgi:hypothetical protein